MSQPDSSALYKVAQWSIFPIALVGTPTVIHNLIAQGVSVTLATYAVVVVLGLLFWFAEWVLPYREHRNTPQNDVVNDLVSGTVAYIIMPIFLKPLYIAMLAGATAWLASQSDGSIWPSDWPLVFQLILMLLLGDAGRYWGHRLAHELPILWRFHAVHHSATRLWWWNATRQHPVDKAWFTFTEMLFPVLLGADGVVLSMYLGVTAVCGYSQHCNINLKLGLFYWIFNVAELHRWHHSKEITQSNNNYGNNLILYDRLFGTYYHPERQGRPEAEVGNIGLLNPYYPQNYLGQLKAPFVTGLDKAPQISKK